MIKLPEKNTNLEIMIWKNKKNKKNWKKYCKRAVIKFANNNNKKEKKKKKKLHPGPIFLGRKCFIWRGIGKTLGLFGNILILKHDMFLFLPLA